MIAKLVYLLCGLTSAGCAILLLRGYAQNRSRLLFWSGLCFVLLGISNIGLFIDLVILPEIDLSFYRNCVTLAALVMLVYGLIWEAS
jgi:hypothetical protein